MPVEPLPTPDTDQRHRLSGVDTAWLRMDDETNLMVVNGVMLFEGRLDYDRLRATAEERLLPIPRFRQRVCRPMGRRRPGPPCWEPDPEFDLDRHLTRGRLPGAAGEAELQDLVSEGMSRSFDPDHPLWHFHLVDNYRAGSALVARFHHCIGDGIALMMVLLSLTDREPREDPAEAADENPFTALFRTGDVDLERVRELGDELMPEGMKLMLKPAEALQNTRRWARRAAATGAFGRMAVRRSDPPTVFKGELGVEKRAAWSDRVGLERIRRLREGFDATVNDVLLTAMAGGLRRYMEGRGHRPDGTDFRATVPVNLRPLDRMAALGNEFGLVFLSLPVGIADPRERLTELKRRMEKLKRSAESFTVLKILGLLGRLPYRLQRLVVNIFGTKATAVMTNVPGPREVLHLAGRPIRDLFFWVPQSGRLGMGISILSYAGNVRVGVATDAGLVPDPEKIVAGFQDELAAMEDALDRGG